MAPLTQIPQPPLRAPWPPQWSYRLKETAGALFYNSKESCFTLKKKRFPILTEQFLMFWEACVLYLHFTAVGSWQAMTYKPLNSMKAQNIWVWIFTAQIKYISITPPCVKLLDRQVWIWKKFWEILQNQSARCGKNPVSRNEVYKVTSNVTAAKPVSLTHAAREMILLFIAREICAVCPHVFEIKLHIRVFLALRWG